VEPLFFESPQLWRDWLDRHHADTAELLVGFHKVGTGRPSMTWSQSVDQALCYGWIDGVRRRLDQASYSIRFTPRRRGSRWSRVNVEKVAELTAAGLMHPAGLAAYADRTEERTARMAFEQAVVELDDDSQARFEADAAAWGWFSAAAPGYRKVALHWVVSAKRAQTRQRRLAVLIECSRDGRKIPSQA
jgi:uncharacterized protein YdeI (YjbR/CyaY-like superfamily)